MLSVSNKMGLKNIFLNVDLMVGKSSFIVSIFGQDINKWWVSTLKLGHFHN